MNGSDRTPNRADSTPLPREAEPTVATPPTSKEVDPERPDQTIEHTVIGAKTRRLSFSRRVFLGMSALAAFSLFLARRAFRPIGNVLNRMGVPVAWQLQGEVKTTYTTCDMCPWRCGVIVKSVNGRVFKIDGNPDDPKSRGMLCARGQAGPSFLYDPDRLKTPLIRTGERGAGEFREASWEEALDHVAAKMLEIRDAHGEESIAFFGHTAGEFWFTDYLPQAWGSPNAAKPSSAICTSPREEAALLTVGRSIGNHEPVDWSDIECITLIGSHIGEDSRNTVMQDFAAARARGASVITVDPRFSTAAMKSDTWLAIKPGTDTALLLAWMNVIIDEGLYDAAYVSEWTTGFDQLRRHVAEYTPEWAATITDLDAEQIRRTARLMARHAPRSAIVPGRHVTWYGNDTQRMRAVYIVNALLGAWGRRGGLYLSKSVYLDAYPHPPFTVLGGAGGCAVEPGAESEELPLGPTGKTRADGVRGEKFLRGPTAIQELIEPMITGDPYPIKGLFAYGVNMFHSLPNVPRTKEAIRNLELFVAIDVLPQDHIAWADVVLPEASYLERYDELWAISHKTPYIALREPAVEPLHNTKPAWWMARELGLRLGLEPFFKWEDASEWINTRLRSVGSSIEKIREAGGVIVQGGKPYIEDFAGESPFPTQSGKIELYSEPLAAAGFDPMPVYEPVADGPAGAYRLLYGRHPAHTFAKTQNTPLLNELYPENEIWINATEAADLGLAAGDRVELTNQDGARSSPIRVKATERIRRDCVFMVHGYGHKAPLLTRAHEAGASDAALQTKYALDPICGGAGLRVNFVTLEKVA